MELSETSDVEVAEAPPAVDRKSLELQDELDLQLQTLLDVQWKEAQEQAGQPFEVAYDLETGEPVDTRPLLVKVAAAESEYGHYLEQGRHREAVRVMVTRMALVQLTYGDPHLRLAQAILTVAKAYLNLLGLPNQAFQHAKECRRVLKAMIAQGMDSEEPLATETLSVDLHLLMGRSLTQLDAYDEAEKALLLADESFRSLPEDKRPTAMLPHILHALGVVHARSERYTEGAEAFAQCLDAVADRNTDFAAGVIRDIGDTELKLKHYPQAIAHLETALLIAKQLHGEESVQAASASVLLARGHIADSDDGSAEGYICEALKIFIASYGHEDERTLQLQDELVKLLMRCERYDAALRLLKRTLAIRAMVYGENSTQVGEGHETFGTIQLAQGAIDKAGKNLRRALDIYKAKHGARHRKTLKLAKLLSAVGGSQDAQAKDKPRFNKY